ncbi:MAG: hypothetical protein HY687_03170 [Chloroflexi bacterium]|nr:hypothetical protein [Chloroflexota bacterium]
MKKTVLTWERVITNCKIFAGNVGDWDYYDWSLKLVDEAWGAGQFDARGVVSGIMVLEYSWNEQFYNSWGLFDQRVLGKCVENNRDIVNSFRKRDVKFSAKQERDVQSVFQAFLEALKPRRKSARSPVAVAKCLHLLAPQFFPLWDNPIAKSTGYHWGDGEKPVNSEKASECYTRFIAYMDDLATQVKQDFVRRRGISQGGVVEAILKEYEKSCGIRSKRTLLKIMDEYLYVEHTRPEWKSG